MKWPDVVFWAEVISAVAFVVACSRFGLALVRKFRPSPRPKVQELEPEPEEIIDVLDEWCVDDEDERPAITWYVASCRRCPFRRRASLPAEKKPAPKVCPRCGRTLLKIDPVFTDWRKP